MIDLDIELHCPRIYETVTEFWEECGIPDHCAGCGGTKAEHVAETNAVIREQEIEDELGVPFRTDSGSQHTKPGNQVNPS